MAISRAEQILNSMIDGTPYDQYPQSRLEDLLLQLKEVIEEGGGGGTQKIAFGNAQLLDITNFKAVNDVLEAPGTGFIKIFFQCSGTSTTYCEIGNTTLGSSFWGECPNGYNNNVMIPVNDGDELKVLALSSGMMISQAHFYSLNIVPSNNS